MGLIEIFCIILVVVLTLMVSARIFIYAVKFLYEAAPFVAIMVILFGLLSYMYIEIYPKIQKEKINANYIESVKY